MKLNKKKLAILVSGLVSLILIIILILLTLSSCTKSEGYKFKKEYESLNNKKSSSDQKYQKIKISKNNKIKYLDKSEIMELLENGTGLIYLGFPNCPWCRGLVPALIDVTNKSELKNIYYLDMTDFRDEYKIENDEVKEAKKGTAEYYKMLELLEPYLDEYIIKDENGIEYDVGTKRIYAPLLIAVKDGIIQEVHSGTVVLNEDQSPYDKLTNAQLSELEVIINNLIDKISVN